MSPRRRSAVIVASTAVGLAAAGGVAYAVDDDTPGEDELTRAGTVTVDEEALPDDDVAEQVALAALATGRHYVGYDTDPRYVALAERRITEWTGPT